MELELLLLLLLEPWSPPLLLEELKRGWRAVAPPALEPGATLLPLPPLPLLAITQSNV